MINTNDNLKNITILDMLGKMVKSISNLTGTNANIDVSNLAEGIYTVEITSENNLRTIKKLIIQ